MEKQYNYGINEQEMVHCVQKGEFKILFTHPEAFISCKVGRKVFQSDLYQDRVAFCVIDEAHLIKERAQSSALILESWRNLDLCFRAHQFSH